MRGLLVYLITFLFSVSAGAELPQSRQQITLSYAPVIKEVSPSVVNIYTKRVVRSHARSPFWNDPFFSPFFGSDLFGRPMRERVENSLGSGFILHESGIIATNAHVIDGAREIMVVMRDGMEYSASLKAIEKNSDIALLVLDEANDKTFNSLPLGNSDTLEVGDLVVAIGNPFGVGQTVTSGIVSAKARTRTDINDFDFFIQTDAAINPGNSGGPLVDMNGHVIGMNTAIYSRSGGSLGIGFAIPAELLQGVLQAALTGQTGDDGSIRRLWHGITAQDMTSDIARSLGLDTVKGALVEKLHIDSPARRAGLRLGDVILAVNTRPIQDEGELRFRIATLDNQTLTLTILQRGRERDITFTLVPPPEIPARDLHSFAENSYFKGVTVANLSPAVQAELGQNDIPDEGVVVTKIRGRSMLGLQVGDIIISVNDTRISSVRRLVQVNSELRTRRGIAVTYQRGGSLGNVILR